MAKLFLTLAAVLAGLGVAIGAFGAHALAGHFTKHPDLETIFETATRYHMYHALALLGLAWAMDKWPGPWLTWAGILLIAGILIFSGSLYILSLTGLRWLGAITPIGGVAFLAGWACLALGVWRG